MSSFSNTTKAQRIIGIVKRLRLPARHDFTQALAGGRSPGPVLAYRLSSLIENHSARAGSKRLTVNAIQNQPAISLAGQQRNRITIDETNIASSQLMEYDFSPLVGLPVPGRYGPGRQASLVSPRSELGLMTLIYHRSLCGFIPMRQPNGKC
jgi:hypothetical protein